MKTLIKTAVLSTCLGLLAIVDVPTISPLVVQLVPEAHAIFGVRLRAWRRGVVAGSSMAMVGAANASTAAAAPPPAPATPGEPLPLGTVVAALPTGCTSTPVDGVAYYYCSGNFYRAVFQGDSLVYVTAKP
jgi:hypothetical protein